MDISSAARPFDCARATSPRAAKNSDRDRNDESRAVRCTIRSRVDAGSPELDSSLCTADRGTVADGEGSRESRRERYSAGGSSVSREIPFLREETQLTDQAVETDVAGRIAI